MVVLTATAMPTAHPHHAAGWTARGRVALIGPSSRQARRFQAAQPAPPATSATRARAGEEGARAAAVVVASVGRRRRRRGRMPWRSGSPVTVPARAGWPRRMPWRSPRAWRSGPVTADVPRGRRSAAGAAGGRPGGRRRRARGRGAASGASTSSSASGFGGGLRRRRRAGLGGVPAGATRGCWPEPKRKPDDGARRGVVARDAARAVDPAATALGVEEGPVGVGRAASARTGRTRGSR